MFERIKLIFQGFKTIGVVKEATKMDGVKPGYLTTEFWTKNLAQLVALGATLAALTGHGVAPAQQAQIVTLGLSLMAGLEALYGVYRSALKFISDWKQGQQAAAAASPTSVVATTTVTAAQ